MSHNQSQQLRMFRLILWQMPPRAKVRVPKQKFQNVGFDFVGFQQLFAAETTSMQRGRSNQKRLDRAPGIECYSMILNELTRLINNLERTLDAAGLCVNTERNANNEQCNSTYISHYCSMRTPFVATKKQLLTRGITTWN